MSSIIARRSGRGTTILRRLGLTLVAFALVATGVAIIQPPPAHADGTGYTIYRYTSPAMNQTYQYLHVPHTTMERTWTTSTEDSGVTNTTCHFYRVHHIDLPAMRALDPAFALWYQAGEVPAPGTFTGSVLAYYGSKGYAETPLPVTTLESLSAQTDQDFGQGVAVVDYWTYQGTLSGDCTALYTGARNKEASVPVMDLSYHRASLTVRGTQVPAEVPTFNFSAVVDHPIFKDEDIDHAYRWMIDNGYDDPRTGADKREYTGSFTSADSARQFMVETFDNYTDPLVSFAPSTSTGGIYIPLLVTSLERVGDGPIKAGAPFDVTLTVGAIAPPNFMSTTGRFTFSDIAPIDTTKPLVLPDGLTIQDPDTLANLLPEGGLTLAEGESRSATITLMPSEDGLEPSVGTWSGTAKLINHYDEQDTNTRNLDVEFFLYSSATFDIPPDGPAFDGEWFRKDLLGEYVRQHDTVPVRLRVENTTGKPLTDVRLTEATVSGLLPAGDGDGDAEDLPEALLTLTGSRTIGGLDATGPTSVGFVDFDLKGSEPGEIELTATITGKDPDDRTVSGAISATWNVMARPLQVTVTPHLRKADGSLPELNMDNNGDGVINELDHQFDVEVEISNSSPFPITDLAFSDPTEPVNWSNNLIGEDQGAPKLTLLGVRGTTPRDDDDEPVLDDDGEPMPGAVNELDVSIPNLAAHGEEGASHTVTFVYEATGELDADGTAIVEGIQLGSAVRGSGSASITFASGLLLQFATWLQDPHRMTTSGQVVRINGYVKNLDEDEYDDAGKVVKEGRPLALWISPMTEGNATNGFLVPGTGGRTPIGAEFIQIAPGEKLDLHGILITKPTDITTNAEVTYRISAWNLPETDGDAALPVEDERIDIVEDPDKGWSATQEQRLLSADLMPQTIKDCESHFYVAIASCNFMMGVGNLLSGVPDMLTLMETGYAELGAGAYWAGAWASQQLGDVIGMLRRDPAAMQRLAAELDVQLSTWYELSILAGDASVTGVAALADFLQEADRVITEGDTETAVAWLAQFAGENPDLALGAIFKARALTAIGQSALKAEARSASASIVREAVDTQMTTAQRELVAEIETAVRAGKDPTVPSVIRSGLKVTDLPQVFRDVYGASRSDLEKMIRIAKEEGILIAFRSRNPISIQLLEDGLAWLKPQSVKAKTVSKIDTQYLGFPEDSFGKVVMLEPPVNPGLRGADLERALDDHMMKLEIEFPELRDPVKAGEVRDRIKMRTTKYHEHLAEWIAYAESGMPVGFEYGKNGVVTPRDVVELRDVRLQVTATKNPLGGPDLTRIDLLVAGEPLGMGSDFRHLTGDIDIVGFFNLDRSPIMEAGRRSRIYEKMRSAVGMQHGETLTWDHQKRAELLREHVGDNAETLLVASPDGEVYTSVLDVAKSSEVAPGGNFAETFTLLDGGPVELTSPTRSPGPPASGILTSIAELTVDKLHPFEPYLIPGGIARVLATELAQQDAGAATSQQHSSPPLMVLPDGSIHLYQPDSADGTAPPPLRSFARTAFATPSSLVSEPVVAARPHPREPGVDPGLVEARRLLGTNNPFPTRPEIGAAGGVWRAITLEEALALGGSGTFELSVQTWTDAPASVGDHALTVLSAADMGLEPGDWFQPGDTVVLDPGGHFEQRLRIAAVNGPHLTFATPIRKPDPNLAAQLGDGIQLLWVQPEHSASDTGGHEGAQAGPDDGHTDLNDGHTSPDHPDGDGDSTGDRAVSDWGSGSVSAVESTDITVLGDAGVGPQPAGSTISGGPLAHTGTTVSQWIPGALLLILLGILALRWGNPVPGRPGRGGRSSSASWPGI